MKIEAGGIYENSCGCVSLIKSEDMQEILHSCGAHKFGEEGGYYLRLNIDAAHLIKRSDVGRWAKDRDGDPHQVLEVLSTHYGVRGKGLTWRRDGSWFSALSNTDLTRWLTREECRARKLNATHPTQRWEHEAKTVSEAEAARFRALRENTPVSPRSSDEMGDPEARRYGTEEGETCGRGGCIGVLCLEPSEGCSCHISPPCGSCVDRKFHCPVCQWTQDEDEPAPVAIASAFLVPAWTAEQQSAFRELMLGAPAAAPAQPLTHEQRYRLALSILCPGSSEEDYRA